MATAEEMKRFHEDQRHIVLRLGVTEDATVALSAFDFDDRDRKVFADIIQDPENYIWTNTMLRDKQGRLLWAIGKGQEEINFTYLESEWADQGGSPLIAAGKAPKSRVRP